MTELVSIAISTYEANGRGPDFLRKNIDSIMNQDYKNIEIVISDHATDSSIKSVCAEYQNDTFPVMYIHNPYNKGNISDNINNAIKHCKGKFIKILFMDDYLFHNEAIKKIVCEFEMYPDKSWLTHTYVHTNNYSTFYNLHHPQESSNIFKNKIGCPSCLVIRNTVSERFDTEIKWYMDYELYYRLNRVYGSPIYLHNSIPYVVQFIHKEQVTNTDITKELILKEEKYIHSKHRI